MKSIIEFGSNSCKILVCDAQQIVSDTRIPLRLLSQLDGENRLADTGLNKILRLVMQQKRELPESELILIGTAALRMAANKAEIVARIAAETGANLRILSAEEEAEYAFKGATQGLKIEGSYLVFDLGGGSLEMIFAKNGEIIKSQSFPLGAVALDKLFRGGDPYTNCCYHYATRHIEKTLKPHKIKVKEVIGSGGALNVMAAVAQKLNSFQSSKIDGYKLTRGDIVGQIGQYRALKVAQIAEVPGMDKARADIILPAALVVQEIFKKTGVGQITVSTKGLRHAFL
ncbi:MAG: hypothetical protein PHC50_08030 [Candidatus Cloacimonetes bacterium]|nr:hypothetical protein [Candidatus Cloacimonadota bacterium]